LGEGGERGCPAVNYYHARQRSSLYGSVSARFPAALGACRQRSSPWEVLKTEFDLYEQDFLTVKHAAEIERYIKMQLRAGSLDGHYERNTRQQFMEVVMGDKYSVSGQAGAVGPQAHAHDMTFTQVWNQLENKVDLARLADELERLRQVMEREATEPSHKLAAGAVAAAEQSARQKDGPKVIEYLKSAGQWSLKIAEQIGVELAKTALKGALGL